MSSNARSATWLQTGSVEVGYQGCLNCSLLSMVPITNGMF